MKELEDIYLDYAEAYSELISMESQIHNRRRLVDELKIHLTSPESDGSFGVEISAHAFKQISERLEELAMQSTAIYSDVFKNDPQESLMTPSNLKSFIITTLANAHKKKHFSRERSKNSAGVEFRYIIDIKKWSGDKTLQFVVIVENNYIKTGFFNWV